jgi:hypothetical protein
VDRAFSGREDRTGIAAPESRTSYVQVQDWISQRLLEITKLEVDVVRNDHRWVMLSSSSVGTPRVTPTEQGSAVVVCRAHFFKVVRRCFPYQTTEKPWGLIVATAQNATLLFPEL